MTTIYSLALHEELKLDRYHVVKRVPNGWLYKSFTGVEKDNFTPIGVEFVPYSTEFFPVIDLTPEPLELGTYNYATSAYIATSPGNFTINYSGEFSGPITISVTAVNIGAISEWQYRKIGAAVWDNIPIEFSVVELDAGGGSIDFECRKLITNPGAISQHLEATFRSSAEGGTIIDDAIARCDVIGTAGPRR